MLKKIALLIITILSSCSNSGDLEEQSTVIPSKILGIDFANLHTDSKNANSVNNLLVGKAIVIDITSRSIHPLHWNLPKEIRSTIVDSISTIICIDVNKKNSGSNQVGPRDIVPFYKYIWEVSIMTLSKDDTYSVVYKESFIGESVKSNYTNYNYTVGQDKNGESVLIVPNSTTNPRNYIVERDAELILGTSGGAELNNGQHLLGVVGEPPYTKALNWILDSKKWKKGASTQRTLWEKLFK